MRRRPRLTAAIAAGAVVGICASVLGFAVVTASPSEATAVDVDGTTPVPEDMAWTWLQFCEQNADVELGSAMAWISTDADGALDVQYGTMDDEGTLDIDTELTEVIGSCTEQRKVLVDPDRPSRLATTAERLAIYDWAVRWQQPCLAAHGYEVGIQPPSAFVDETTVPWYLIDQYIWTGTDGLAGLDFDALLAARLACPPVPARLAAQGVGW